MDYILYFNREMRVHVKFIFLSNLIEIRTKQLYFSEIRSQVSLIL